MVEKETQREAKLCGLSIHWCHHFLQNSLAETASQMAVEYRSWQLYFH